MTEVDGCSCCTENEAVARKMEEVGGVRRITEIAGFIACCLNVWSLQTAYYGYRQQHGHHRHERLHKCVGPHPLYGDNQSINQSINQSNFYSANILRRSQAQWRESQISGQQQNRGNSSVASTGHGE